MSIETSDALMAIFGFRRKGITVMKWISVKDGFPNFDGDYVLCFWRTIIGDEIDGDNYGVAKYENGKWLSTDFSGDEYIEPVAWMYLPNPPKGQ